MKQYIDKSALVAELNRLIAELVEEGEDTMFEQGRISALEDVKVFINHTLEVKEEPVSVDLANAVIEYTRTDAFIKRACEGIEHLLSGYIIRNFHFGDSYEIDTLIEDFKNYMKGE